MVHQEIEDEARRARDEPFVDSGPSEDFSDSVASLLMEAEEWRRSLTKTASIGDVVSWRQAMENIFQIIRNLERWTDDSAAGNSSIQADLLRSCQEKTLTVTIEALELLWKTPEPAQQEVPDTEMLESIRQDWQGSVARMTELYIVQAHCYSLRFSDKKPPVLLADMVQSYVNYQKETLRRRVTPSVAQLKQARVSGAIKTTLSSAAVYNESDQDNDGATPSIVQHHAPVLAAILGQALVLQHPLITWYVQLQSPDESNDPVLSSIRTLCSDSIAVLDSQTQTIVETIIAWFWEDQPIDEWIQKLADEHMILSKTELAQLNALVDEMAFGAQVQARYSQFSASTGLELVKTIQEKLLPEWTWKYATLERSLATTQWSYALSIAAPVSIVLGTPIKVPSVLEDAQYLSTRALERAATTTSLQAMGTVAHAVAHDIWSVEAERGVFNALAEQIGCYAEEIPTKTEEEEQRKDKGESDFASALLDALDDDHKSQNVSQKPPSAPTSGNFLTTLALGGSEKVEQMQLESLFCALNGTHAANGACRTLVSILDSLLEEEQSSVDKKATAMVQLAREELFRFAAIYETQLNSKIEECISRWCGSVVSNEPLNPKRCIEAMQLFFISENYNITEQSIQELESDARLDQALIQPFRSSVFIEQMTARSEPDTLTRIGLFLTNTVVDAVLKSVEGKQLSEWGAILYATETQLVQQFVSKILSPPLIEGGLPPPPSPDIISAWERLSQTVTVLQLEKPDDWLVYASTSVLSVDVLRKTLSMRIDFKPDAIDHVVKAVSRDDSS